MTKYIDAVYIAKRLTENLPVIVDEDMKDIRGQMEYAISILKFAPAADVTPIVHSRWFPYNKQTLICDNCSQYWITKGDQYDFKYCPNCGAKMDEQKEG